jgi:hypothetical protein
MAPPKVISSVSEFIDTINEPSYQIGLFNAPVTPWYLGQPDLKSTLVPGMYKAGIEPGLEREMLRDYRMMSAELISLKGLYDADIMISAYLNGLPLRILEWSSNPLVALYFAVESLNIVNPGRVWILNPWVLNDLVAGLVYVPMTDSEYFKKYVVKLDDPDASTFPEATQPMAFRPYRSSRTLNTQNLFFTVHGKNPAALEDLSFFLKRAEAYLTYVEVEAGAKISIMNQLHDLGVSRFALFPTLSGLTRTVAYRHSQAYLKG